MKKTKTKQKTPTTTRSTPQSRRTSWSEGDPPPDSPVVEELHVEGITYQRKFIACGKDVCRKGCAQGRASHGPYWYAVTWNAKTGKTKSTYIGKQAPSLHQIAAAVGADL